MNNNMEKEIFDIYLEDIIPNRFQPRLTFDDKSLNELADSIRLHGIIQPLVVRKVGDKYEIIAGERRYKAAGLVGLQKVPAVIMNLDDKQSAEVAVIENIQRKDLTSLEEAESYKKLLDKGYLTQEQLASRMGKAQATISNKLRLLGLTDEVKEAILNEKISERHARSLLSLKDSEQQKNMLEKIINNRLTVKETDDMIKEMTGQKVDSSEPVESNPLPQPFVVQSNVPSFDVPNIPIKTPVVEAMPPLVDPDEPAQEPIQEKAFTNFEPIQNIDINQMKEGAIDINPVHDPVDMNALLGIPFAPKPPVSSEPVTPQPRFINPLEDEEANMEMQEPSTDPVKQEINDEPVPFVEQPKPEEEQAKPSIDSSIVPFAMQSSVAPTPNMESEPGATPNVFQPVMETPAVEQPIASPINQPAQPIFEVPIVEPEVIQPAINQEPVSTGESEPKTFTDSLIQEYRQGTNPIDNTPSNIISGDLRGAINTIRDTVRGLEKNDFKIDIEEFDFEKLYQIIIKINK